MYLCAVLYTSTVSRCAVDPYVHYIHLLCCTVRGSAVYHDCSTKWEVHEFAYQNQQIKYMYMQGFIGSFAGGTAKSKQVVYKIHPSRGVWGHAPQKIFEKITALRSNLVGFGS